ncbi:hypothetical protein HDU76_008368 [Blyttiomyces sp. JEL0837]|nr:hypothetical protein HDU76_008368 [Blyttiomyces sp. JEL0837]
MRRNILRQFDMAESFFITLNEECPPSIINLNYDIQSHDPIASAASAKVPTKLTGTSNDVTMGGSGTTAVSRTATSIQSDSQMSICQAVTATRTVTRKLAMPKLRSGTSKNTAPTLTATSASSSSGVGLVTSTASLASGSHIAVSSGSNDAAAALLSLPASAKLRSPTTLATHTVSTQQTVITNDGGD